MFEVGTSRQGLPQSDVDPLLNDEHVNYVASLGDDHSTADADNANLYNDSDPPYTSLAFEWLEMTMSAAEEPEEETDYHQEVMERLSAGLPLYERVEWVTEEEAMIEQSEDEDETITQAYSELDNGYSMSGAQSSRTNSHPSTDCPTYPWPSKSMFLTDLLFSSPRLRFSRAQKYAILNWAKELGAKDVPDLRQLERCHERIKKSVGDPTTKYNSTTGDVFYLNDIGKAIAKDFANPLLRPDMQFFPEDAGDGMSQAWHGDKWLFDAPGEALTPMVEVKEKHFYIDELVRCSDNQYFIPQRFIICSDDQQSEKTLNAIGRNVTKTPNGFVVDSKESLIAVSSFEIPFIELSKRSSYPGFAEESRSFAEKMPNPVRQVAKGRVVYSVPLIIFMDDVSGNVSKQWNKHYNIYMSNGSLPREALDKEFCTRFVTTSPHVPPMELMRGVKSSIEKAFKEGIVSYDYQTRKEVLLRPFALFFPGDNPMQAELCSHSGLQSNYFCRACKVGGTKEHKASNTGFMELFNAGAPRQAAETAKEVHQQVLLSTKSGGTEKVEEHMRNTGVKDAITSPIINSVLRKGIELRKKDPGRSSAKLAAHEKALLEEVNKKRGFETMNPLFDLLSVDVHRDTPTEILHTVLLGVVKYFWGQTVVLLDKAKCFETTFRARLSSFDSEGLNIPKVPADYICRHHGSLIGKHFKSLAQLMSFLIYDLVPKNVVDAWNLIGRLVVLLWHTEIESVEAYITTLQTTIQDFLNITAQCAPSILLTKPKFHFLVHLPEYIQRFGPALLFSTERYESFNAVFRLSCILSNRHSPSRDSSITFAYQDIIKHIATGGWWYSESDQRWIHAGHRVTDHIIHHAEYAKLLGLNVMSKGFTGKVMLQRSESSSTSKQKKPSPKRWDTTLTFIASGNLCQNPEELFYTAKCLMAENGDNVKVGSYAIFQNPQKQSSEIGGSLLLGRVIEILAAVNTANKASFIAIKLLKFKDTRHSILNVPTLLLTDTTLVTTSEDVLCAVNVQHDCSLGKCHISRYVPIRHEGEETANTQPLVLHSDDEHFTLNIHSLHNYRLIRDVTPAQLRNFESHSLNVEELRNSAAAQVRSRRKKQQEERRIKDAAKKGELRALKDLDVKYHRNQNDCDKVHPDPDNASEEPQIQRQESRSHMLLGQASNQEDAIIAKQGIMPVNAQTQDQPPGNSAAQSIGASSNNLPMTQSGHTTATTSFWNPYLPPLALPSQAPPLVGNVYPYGSIGYYAPIPVSSLPQQYSAPGNPYASFHAQANPGRGAMPQPPNAGAKRPFNSTEDSQPSPQAQGQPNPSKRRPG
ncbi:hypothetical protein FRC02_008455 [Tulasnella sp. 418]|nr:hypothetical protein FRC02_008455 [Tulasnella sp. 418]